MQEKLVLTASVKGRKNSLSYYSTFIGIRDITIEKIEKIEKIEERRPGKALLAQN